MIKKLFYWIFSVLQVLLLISAYAIQYFSMKKMGMMRYVVFKNHSWENQYPIGAIQYIVIALLVVLAVISILLYVRRKYTLYKSTLRMILAQVIITLIFVFFTVTYSTESYRSYYFISIILAIITVIQAIKILACKKENV